MKVKLIQITQNPIDVMWTAARTCYASNSPVEMWDKITDYSKFITEIGNEINVKIDEESAEQLQQEKQKRWNLVKKVLDSGHQSIAEHVYFTFAIEGISRACSHQLVRHRAGIVFSQQSQRYVEIKEDLKYLEQLYKETRSIDDVERLEAIEKLSKIVDKYFVKDNDKIGAIKYFFTLIDYLTAIQDGCKPEDARQLLPNATKTNITMSCNFRELIHICNLRLCTRAQTEIKQLFTEIVKCVKEQDERLAQYLVPQCEVNGFCTEKNCCGRKPSLNQIKEDFLTKEEMQQLLKANENPQVNEKLQKLIKMRSVFS